MQGTTLYIKNMVCDRCIMVVRELLNQLGFTVQSVELGKAVVAEEPDAAQREKLRGELQALGFELLDDKRMQLVEQMRNAIIELVHYQQNQLKVNLSQFLSDKFHHDYSFLSKLFSEETGTTIEKYLIAQKIERVKELLMYGELSLSEIALTMNYSSVAHLSTQFKNVTGMTPSAFKQQKVQLRKPLDKV